ncbi:MAG: hypothetical protein ACTSVL_06875, partial [Promethearchaeota archaeon]
MPTFNLNEIHCSFCGTKIEPFQLDALQQGNAVYCSACGHQFSPLYSAKTHKSSISSKQPSSTESSRTPNNSYSSHYSSSYPNSINQPTSIPRPSAPSLRYGKVDYSNMIKSNKKKRRETKKENKRNFLIPMNQDEENYDIKLDELDHDYSRIKSSNEHKFQLALLDYENSAPEELFLIKKEYKRVSKENKQTFNNVLRTFKRHYSSIHQKNELLYQSTVKKNKLIFRDVQKKNKQSLQIISKSGLTPQFTPLMYKPEILQFKQKIAYNPNEGMTEYKWVEFSVPSLISKNKSKILGTIPIKPRSEIIRDSEGHYKVPLEPKTLDSELAKTIQNTEVKRAPSKLIKRFDPYTGKPLNTGMKFNPLTGKPIIIDSDIKEEPSPIENPIELEKPKEIYDVLEADVRNKLVKLPISEEDRVIIARTFIYLSYEQQMKYLEEIKSVNTSPEYRKELTNAIKNLPISQKQKEVLMKQLDYLSDEKQTDFVDTLKDVNEEDLQRIAESKKKEEEAKKKEEEAKKKEEEAKKKEEEYQILLKEKEKLLQLKREK